LLVRDLGTLSPCGGGQEKGYRRGTQDVPGALGFAAALAARPYDMARMGSLRNRIETGIKAAGASIIGDDSPRVPTIGAISLPGATSASLLIQLDLAGFAVSAGSACASGKAKASHVLGAMAVPDDVAAGFLRLSFGPATSEAQVDAFLAEFGRIAARSRANGSGKIRAA
jgi:cysteine desulfurase